MFLNVLNEAALKKCRLKPDKPILVGVSGGADSLALALGLDIAGFPLKIAHLDHGLRSQSKDDAEFIRAFAVSRNLEFVSTRVNVAEAAKAERQSIEEAARIVRYQFLFEQARQFGAQAVAVGHNADDQVETVLMHLLRGSGLSGLTGMSYRTVLPQWDETIPVVRPLLGLWRFEIETFIDEMGLSPRIDHTNQDVTYFRNKLRHMLIPELENYNPQIRQAIWRMSDVLREENHVLENLTRSAWEDCLVRKNQSRVILYSQKIIDQPEAVQRRLVRNAISQLRPDLRDVGYEALSRAIAFMNDDNQTGEIDLVARLNIAKFEDYLILKTWQSEMPDWQMPLIPANSKEEILDEDHPVLLRHGWRLEARLFGKVPGDTLKQVKNLGSDEVWLDYDLLEMPLSVRRRKQGERWQPLGMEEHTQKLKDFMINEKIPEHFRNDWPLVCSASRIAWVVNYRPSEIFKITENTKNYLQLRLVRIIA